jgi:hypothetical protein
VPHSRDASQENVSQSAGGFADPYSAAITVKKTRLTRNRRRQNWLIRAEICSNLVESELSKNLLNIVALP